MFRTYEQRLQFRAERLMLEEEHEKPLWVREAIVEKLKEEVKRMDLIEIAQISDDEQKQ
jgi:hypothetical protein